MKKSVILNFFHLFLFTLFLAACTPNTSFPRSKAFYINDRAGALLTSTEYFIYALSNELSEEFSATETWREKELDGSQIVVATHLGAPGSIDTTAIYNDWGIGRHNLGMLFMLYFENGAAEYEYTYLGMTREIGSKMSGFIAMSRLESIFINTFEANFNSGVHAGSYDYALMSFYYHVINEVLVEVYNHNTFNPLVALDDYEIEMYESYYYDIPRDTSSSLELPWWAYLIIILLFILFGGGGTLGYVISVRGGGGTNVGGGSSHGYKHTR